MLKQVWSDESSNTERVFAKILELLEIDYKFEPRTDDIIPSRQGTIGKYKPVQYTPDFYFEHEGKMFMIETKGFARARDHLINSIADAWYTSRGYNFFVITLAGTERDSNRNFYLYKNKGIPKRGMKAKTFFERIGLNVPHETYIKAKLEVRAWEKENLNYED